MELQKKQIQSFGLITANSYYFRPENTEQILDCISYARKNNLKICPMGGGMSFSDVGLIDHHICLDIKALNQIISFDPVSGIIVAQAGTLTTAILSVAMPQGWHLCGLSGSLFNTIAGDISNNINGKDSWKYGNFGRNVIEMKIILADGTLMNIDRQNHPELFNAVISGMGLLGIIIEVTFQLIKIPSFMIECKSEKVPNLQSLLDKMEQLNTDTTLFNYAWLDAFAEGNKLGRSIIETAGFTENTNSISNETFQKGLNEQKKIGFLTPEIFWKLFKASESQTAFRIVNSLKYHSADNSNFKTKITTFPQYQYPMVKYLPKWNLLYIPGGFREFQPLIHKDYFSKALNDILKVCRAFNAVPRLCAIRKHHPEEPYLSFSGEGYSFTIPHDLNHFSKIELEKFSRKLIDIVIKYNGKIYLGKYPYLTAEECRLMYPEYDNFLKEMNRYNPDRLFYSNAAARLFP